MIVSDPLNSARELRTLIESEADQVEESGTLTEPVVEALSSAGLFGLSTPADLGGVEADAGTILDVCEEISFADGSVGWAFAQNITVGAYAAYLEPEFAIPLAQARASAGMFAPLGVAHEEEGGFRVSGHYQFGSGCGHAEFMGGAALRMRDGEIAPIEAGSLPVIAFIVPIDRVELKGNWDVMGLSGTGSFDFEVPEQFVEAGRTFPILGTPVLTGGPIYGIGPIPVGTISSCGWALGVAKRALHEIAGIARGGRTRLGSLPLREQPGFQRDFGIHRMALESVRLLAHAAYATAVDAAAGGAAPEILEDRIRETKAAATYATRVVKQAVTFAWEASGSVGIRNPSRLQRCFRDTYVGCAHQVFDDRNYQQLARPTLGIEPEPF